MKAIYQTKKFDINLKSPFTTYYTAIAHSKERVIEMLCDQLDIDRVYNLCDFEIECNGFAVTQSGSFLDEEFISEM